MSLGQRKTIRWLSEGVAFAFLAVWATWPLASHLDTHLAQGVERSASVPLLNLWTLWWNVESLDRQWQGVWDAPIYWPTERMLAGSEPQLAAGCLAWPVWHLIGRPVAVFNAILLLHLTLNGWVSCRLLEALRVHRVAVWAGGAAVALLPLVHWQIGVAQLASLWTVSAVLWALRRFEQRSTLLRAWWLGTTTALVYLFCSYYGLMFGLLLTAGLPVIAYRRRADIHFWRCSVVAIGVAGALVAPVAYQQWRFDVAHPVKFPPVWFDTLSARPADFLHTPARQMLSVPVPNRDGDRFSWPLSPGTIKACLAMWAVAVGLMARHRRRWTIMLAVMLAVAVLLSLGPHLHIGVWRPHDLLSAICPGFSSLRNLFRFAIFVQLFVVLLAVMAIQDVARRWGPRIERLPFVPNRRLPIRLVLLVAIGGLLVLETIPKAPRLYGVPPPPSDSSGAAWLAEPAHRVGAIAHLPLPVDRRAKSHQVTTEQMYYQMWHGRPMVNGYSARVPSQSLRIERMLRREPVSPTTLTKLAAMGVTHYVVELSTGFQRDERVWKDAGLVRVWRSADRSQEIWNLESARSARGAGTGSRGLGVTGSRSGGFARQTLDFRLT